MSFVMTMRSYRSRNDLQSISTRVVFPDPTGPPMPMRKGGFRLVRWSLLMSLRAKQTRILVRMPRRQNSKMGGESGDFLGTGVDRAEHDFGNECVHGKKDFLSRNLTERDGFDSRGYLVLDPTETVGRDAGLHLDRESSGCIGKNGRQTDWL